MYHFLGTCFVQLNFAVVLFGSLFYVVFSQTVCPCDLTQNACDVNCCCDPDCSTADKNAFTFCLNVDLNTDDRVCVSNQIINIANVKYRTTGTSGGLFCIYTDNNKARNFYTTVQTATSATSFDNLFKQYGGTNYQPLPIQPTTYLKTSVYKAGDPVMILFSSNIQGYLALPKQSIGSSECDDQNPVAFLKKESTKCSRFITDLAAQCTANAGYSSQSYYTGFKFIPGPSFLAEKTLVYNVSSTINATQSLPASSISLDPSVMVSSGTSSVSRTTTTTSQQALSTYNDASLVTAELLASLVCTTQAGTTGPCSFSTPPRPTYDFASNICKNVLLKASYTIMYNDNTTSLSISRVTVTMVLGDVASSQKSFNQEFSVQFQKAGSSSSFSRSGNPGYVTGLSVMAGSLQTNAQLKKEVIVLNSDPTKWLTLIHASTNTNCGANSKRTSVKFGLNMRTGCFVSIKRSMTTQECILLQNTIYNSLMLQFPTHVAMFGNSALTNTADWVKIINNRPQITSTASNGQCINMILGIHTEILHSKTGYLNNAQSRIVGVQVKYDSPRTISFRCTGSYCQPGSSSLATQQIEVVQSVSFIDVSIAPEAQLKPKPTFQAKAPYDFFYPFV